MRHDLVAVPLESWPGVLAARPPAQHLSGEQEAVLAGWAAKGWPTIVRRPLPGEAREALPVGLPLPPSLGKMRVTLSLPAGLAWTKRDEVTLSSVVDVLPEPWRETADAIVALGLSLGLQPRVYGATLWQTLTGLRYIRAGSDLDLLWPVEDADLLAPLVTGLARVEAAGSVRIDGEVLVGEAGVNWREIEATHRGDTALVLAKTLDAVRLTSVDRLFSPAPAAC